MKRVKLPSEIRYQRSFNLVVVMDIMLFKFDVIAESFPLPIPSNSIY